MLRPFTMPNPLLAHFAELLAYDRWANERAIASIESVPQDRRTGKAYERLTALVPHNLIARRVWIRRMRSEPYEMPRAWFPPMTPPETRAMAREVDAEWDAFLPSVTDADLERVVVYRTSDGVERRGVFRRLLTHVFNHGTYHRGQIARLVTEHAGTRADTDFHTYADELARGHAPG